MIAYMKIIMKQTIIPLKMAGSALNREPTASLRP